MIGQHKLLRQIDSLIDNFPHTFLIIGEKGSGKKTIADYIAKKLNIEIIIVNNKVQEIKDVIEYIQIAQKPTLFVFDDVNSSHILKVIEDIPNNMYFCITAENEFNVLSTIKSRSVIFKVQPYTKHELRLYDSSINLDFCTNINDINILRQYDNDKFINFVKKVSKELQNQNLYNALKIHNMIKQYDLRLFFKAYMTYNMKYQNITNKYMNDIGRIDDDKIIDNWIIDIVAGD